MWIPKGRKIEAGSLSPNYQIQEIPTASYPAWTEQNVLDSGGILILSHGPLAGVSAFTEKAAKKHKKPILHIDLTETSRFGAARLIASWIAQTRVGVLNVVGQRANKDLHIYKATKEIMRTVVRPGKLPSSCPTR